MFVVIATHDKSNETKHLGSLLVDPNEIDVHLDAKFHQYIGSKPIYLLHQFWQEWLALGNKENSHLEFPKWVAENKQGFSLPESYCVVLPNP